MVVSKPRSLNCGYQSCVPHCVDTFLVITNRKMSYFRSIPLYLDSYYYRRHDMETYLTNVAGLDVHKKEIVACVIVGPSDDEAVIEVKTFQR